MENINAKNRTKNGIESTILKRVLNINDEPLIVPLNEKNLLILITSFIKFFLVVFIQSVKQNIDKCADSY